MEEKAKTKKVQLKKNEVEELSIQIELLKNEIKLAQKEIVSLNELSEKVTSKISRIDKTYLNDLSKLYGFSGKEMYYIGCGSGRIYHKPINDEIISLIERFDTLNWKQIQSINQYFMK